MRSARPRGVNASILPLKQPRPLHLPIPLPSFGTFHDIESSLDSFFKRLAGETSLPFGMTDTQSLQDLLSKQEELLKSINDKLPPVDLALAEVRLLESIQKQLSSSKDEVEDKARRRLDFLWNVFLQILGVAFVVLFGSFSALAYISAQVANFQSINSNQISLLSLCLANSSVSITSLYPA